MRGGRLYSKYPEKFIHFTRLKLVSTLWSFYTLGYLPTKGRNWFMTTPIRQINAWRSATEGLFLSSIKAAKYEIQKPLTCRATLFRCKFWIDVSRFSSCVINLSRNKNICCGLKKCSALIGWFAWRGSNMAAFVAWQVVSLMKNEQQSQNLLLKVDQRSTFRNTFFQPATNVFVAEQVDRARWKTGNMD